MAHGNINDSFLEDELRLIYEALYIRNVFVMEIIKNDYRVYRAANRAGHAATQSEMVAGATKLKKGAQRLLPHPPPGQHTWTTLAFHPRDTVRDGSWKAGPEYNVQHICVCCCKTGRTGEREEYRRHEDKYGCSHKILYLAEHPDLLVATRLRALQVLEDNGHVPTWKSLRLMNLEHEWCPVAIEGTDGTILSDTGGPPMRKVGEHRGVRTGLMVLGGATIHWRTDSVADAAKLEVMAGELTRKVPGLSLIHI